MNPAVSLALMLTRKMSVMRAVFYMVAQILGASLGSLICKDINPDVFIAQSGGINEVADGVRLNVTEGDVAVDAEHKWGVRARSPTKPSAKVLPPLEDLGLVPVPLVLGLGNDDVELDEGRPDVDLQKPRLRSHDDEVLTGQEVV